MHYQNGCQSPMMGYPFLYFGHGTSRVSDDFAIWLVLGCAVSDREREWIEAAMPAPLREWATETGELRWQAQVLYVNSGMDFKYAVQRYDKGQLSWIDEKLTALSSDDIARVMAEVMNDEQSGPRSPKASVWQLFDAEIDLWLARVHQRHPLEAVVKGVRLTAKHDSAWHQWSAETAVTQLPAIVERFGAIKLVEPSAGLLMPFVRQMFGVVPPKRLTEGQRASVVDLLAFAGAERADALAEIVSCLPVRQRAPYVATLIERHHPQVLSLFLEGKTHTLLLDDTLFDVARQQAPHCAIPTAWWLIWLPERLKIRSWDVNCTRPTLAADSAEWARRVYQLADANGSFVREAQHDDYSQRRHVQWNALRHWLPLRPADDE